VLKGLSVVASFGAITAMPRLPLLPSESAVVLLWRLNDDDRPRGRRAA